MAVYYISDLHLGHKNAIDFGARPFDSVTEMEEEIVRRWNKKVHADDLVYVLGDFTLGEDAARYAARLKGRKILIRGNHDLWLRKEKNKGLFEKVTSMEEINVDGKWITLCHYPMLEWHGSRRQPTDKSYGYLIYGHIHNNVKELYRRVLTAPNALNAGVDVNGFEPVTFEELVFNNRAFQKRALEILSTMREGEEGIVVFSDMTLASAPFEMIARGEKRVEMRLFDKKRQRLALGHVIRFTSAESGEKLFAKVISLDRHSAFEEAFANDTLRRAAGFSGCTAKEGAERMRAYYTEEEEAQGGVLAIGIELL